MDVVRQRVEALRGTIHVSSRPGSGLRSRCVFRSRWRSSMGCWYAWRTLFCVPLANSLECVELTREDIANANGRHVANVRGEIIPYIRLREHFDITHGTAGARADHDCRN